MRRCNVIDPQKIGEMIASHILWLRDENTGERADFSHIDLSGVDMRVVCLNKALFKFADMSGAMMDDSEFEECDFYGASLVGASLLRSSLWGSDLRYSDFTSTKLSPTVFGECEMVGVIGLPRHIVISGVQKALQPLCANGKVVNHDEQIIYWVDLKLFECGMKTRTAREFAEYISDVYGDDSSRYGAYMNLMTFATSVHVASETPVTMQRNGHREARRKSWAEMTNHAMDELTLSDVKNALQESNVQT